MSKEAEIYLRKQKIWELFLEGLTQQQIAEKLGVSVKTVYRDFQELKNESVEWMKSLPQGEIQIQYQRTFATLDKVQQKLWDIFENTQNESLKVKILSIITKRCKMHADLMNNNHLLEVRRRVGWELDSPFKSDVSSFNKLKFEEFLK